MGALGQVDHLDGVDQLVQLLNDLLGHLIVTLSGQSQSRQCVVVGRCHGQGINIVAALRKQTHNPGERTGFVFQQDRNNTFH